MTEKVTKKRKRSHSRQLRDQQVRALAASGMTQTAIAEQMGMSREGINKIMNSEETKLLVKLGEDRMKRLMTKMIDTLEFAMDNKHEYGGIGAAVKVALDGLRSMGVVKNKVEMEHTFPEPTVISKGDGTQVVLGYKDGDEDEDDNEN